MSADQTPLTASIIEAFSDVAGILAIYNADADDGHTSHYLFEIDEVLVGDADVLRQRMQEILTNYPDSFAWAFTCEPPNDGFTRVWPVPVQLGLVHGGAGPSADRIVDNADADLARAAFSDLPGVVRVTSAPIDANTGTKKTLHVTAVARIPVTEPPSPQLVAALAHCKRAHDPEDLWIVQLAPELNFPPDVDVADSPDAELISEAMRIIKPYRMVEAAWFEPCNGDELPSGPYSSGTVYLFGEDDDLLVQRLRRLNVLVCGVSKLAHVPPTAVCIFNDITRMLVAQAEGDAATVKTIQQKIASASAANREAAVSRSDLTTRSARSDLKTRLVPCRWCQALNPASTNPEHTDACPSCGAFQAATMIPLKKAAVPVLALFINPDSSLFLEFVGAPPAPGRLDLSETRRYTIPASACEIFDQNPMGKRDP